MTDLRIVQREVAQHAVYGGDARQRAGRHQAGLLCAQTVPHGHAPCMAGLTRVSFTVHDEARLRDRSEICFQCLWTRTLTATSGQTRILLQQGTQHTVVVTITSWTAWPTACVLAGTMLGLGLGLG